MNKIEDNESSKQYFQDNFFKCHRCKRIIQSSLYNCNKCDPPKIYCLDCFNKNNNCDECKELLLINKWYNQLDIKTVCPLHCSVTINLNQLKEHLKVCKNRDNSFECNLCEDEIFEKKDIFIQHILDKHKDKVYEMFSE